MQAIVVGAGFGGIASALRLRAKGYEVRLIDRCEMIGGRAQVYMREGFRHDAGPTVITAPFLLEELFILFGERMEDSLKLVPLKPWYRFEFSDGDHFDYGGTLEDTLAEISRIEPRDREGYLALLAHSRRIFDVGFTELSAQPFDRLSTMLRQVPRLVGLRNYETVWSMVKRHLQSEKLRQAFSIQPLLVGGNPFDTTSIYGLIHFLERAYGVHFAMGGTGAVTAALGGLMKRHGIEIQLNTSVASIVIEQGRATGICLEDGTKLTADVVVSNADAAHLYRAMIPPAQQSVSSRLKLAAAHYSMGLFVIYFGTTRTYPAVAHHTVWMGSRYRELLVDIFHRKILADDFSLYLHRPTATDDSMAPPGCDSFYVLAPVPHLGGKVDWAKHAEPYRKAIEKRLEETVVPGLGEALVTSRMITPQDFQDRLLSVNGAAFALEPQLFQSAWFRPHNVSEEVLIKKLKNAKKENQDNVVADNQDDSELW